MHLEFKYPDESREYTFDFAPQKEIRAGDTIATVDSVTATTGDGELTIGTPASTDKTVVVRISEGTAGQDYILLATVTTAAANVLVVEGLLKVRSTLNA